MRELQLSLAGKFNPAFPVSRVVSQTSALLGLWGRCGDEQGCFIKVQETEQIDGEELLDMIASAGAPLYLAPDAPSVRVPYRDVATDAA